MSLKNSLTAFSAPYEKPSWKLVITQPPGITLSQKNSKESFVG